jgi:hypothetical protein
MAHKGSCHCGKIAFEVDGDPKEVLSCNCSMCSRKGSLLWFVPRETLRLLTPEADMSTYTFNRHNIRHHFCGTCGIHPFGEANDPRSGKPMAAVNTRCLEDVDFATLAVKHFNGRAL